MHGALIDARLLASVYLELKGGKERVLDLTGAKNASTGPVAAAIAHGPRPRPLPPRSTAGERDRHAAFLQANLKDLSLWTAIAPELADEPA